MLDSTVNEELNGLFGTRRHSGSECEWKTHPAADLFPPMSEEEYQTLKADIEKNGLQTPITVRDGMILDGRHRLRACKELGIQWLNYLQELDEGDPVELSLSLNLHRRHLTPSQMAMVADKARGVFDAEAKERQDAGRKKGGKTAGNGRKSSLVENLPPSKTPDKKARDKAAELVGVSGRLVDDAKTVRTKGVPELAEAVESGNVSVSAAATVAKMLPKKDQKKAVEEGTVKQKAAEVRRSAKSSKAPKPQSKPDQESASVALSEILKQLNHQVSQFLKSKPTADKVEPLMIGLSDQLTRLEEYMAIRCS
ncbi:MAG: hypothetical protein Fues2KO_52880 [Fuerstiella sp.]